MTIPPNNINDLPKSERAKLQALLYERSMTQYVFSFERLIRLLSNIAGPGQLDTPSAVLYLQQCIVAWTEEEAKTLKTSLNDKITAIYTENGIEKTLRHFDPFGRAKDFIMMEGTATSFSKERALEYAVSKKLLSAKKFTEIMAAGTSQSKYVTLQARDVKASGEVDDSLPGRKRG